MQRKPTMSDVARLAGVGTMTVSRVLNRTARVSSETEERVRDAIKKLHYRPNELARAFRGQRSRSIGLLVPYLFDPFFATCAHAASVVAREHGYSVITATTDEDPETEYGEIEQMLQRHVEGLLIIPAQTQSSRLTRTLFGRTPVVFFDRPGVDDSLDSVLVENTEGARKMVEHLVGHGHRKISFMSMNRSLFTMEARYQGYSEAMRQAGLVEDVSFNCATAEDAEREVASRIKAAAGEPVAFFTANNLTTRSVFGALVHLGVKIPAEAAIAAFDDSELSELTSPPISVVRQPSYRLGESAARLLCERIEAEEEEHAACLKVLPVEIVLRRSCGCKGRHAAQVPLKPR